MTARLVRLLDGLFAGVLEDPPWVSFLEILEEELPGHHSTMVLRRPRSGDPGTLIAPSGNSEALSLLQERIFQHSPFLDLPVGEICFFHEMLTPTTRRQYAEYLAYLRAFNTVDLLGLNLVDTFSGMTFRLRCARIEGEPEFGPRERKLLKSLLPRLQTAIGIYGRLVAQRNQLQIYDATSEKLAMGALLLNERGEILIKNAVADRLLEARDGLYSENGILHCLHDEDDHSLRTLLAEIAGAAGDRSLTIQRGIKQGAAEQGAGAGRCWNALLRPAEPGVALGDNTARAAMLFIRDIRESTEVSVPTLRELFGLTRAEAALAVRLVQGQSLDEAASATNISRYTARAQLSAIFAKTGTHRQPQLVSLILNTAKDAWS